MFSYFEKLVTEGYIRVADYTEFVRDEVDKELYKGYFQVLHDRLREYLDVQGGKKKLDKLVLAPGQDLFNYRKAGMSLGDVHMILMAAFIKIPVILSDDADMDALKCISKNVISYSNFELTILSCVEVFEKIALLEGTSFSKAELLELLKKAGENKNKSRIIQAWNSVHN